MTYVLKYMEPYEFLCKKCKHKKIDFRQEKLIFDSLDNDRARAQCKEFLNETIIVCGKRVKRKLVELIQYIDL